MSQISGSPKLHVLIMISDLAAKQLPCGECDRPQRILSQIVLLIPVFLCRIYGEVQIIFKQRKSQTELWHDIDKPDGQYNVGRKAIHSQVISLFFSYFTIFHSTFSFPFNPLSLPSFLCNSKESPRNTDTDTTDTFLSTRKKKEKNGLTIYRGGLQR